MRERLNLRHVWTVFSKEMSDTIRDRRTWWTMIILPVVIVPLMTLVAPRAAIKQIENVQETASNIIVVGADKAPTLVDYLKGTGDFNLVQADPATALGNREALAIVYVPADFEASLKSETPAQVRVAYDASDQKSSLVQGKVGQALSAFSQGIIASRLQAKGINPAIISPLAISLDNVAPKERMGATLLSLILPMLLAMWAATGGMYAAIDLAAGEKERGTLEALMTVPVSRISIAVGKYLVVVISSIIAATISVVGFAVAFKLSPISLEPGQVATFGLSMAQIGWLFLIALTLSAFFAAIELTVSSFARGFREAQTYLTPVTFIIIIPWMLTQFSAPADIPAYFFYIPVMNSVMAFKELVMGIVNPTHLRDALVFSLVYITIALRLAGQFFRRESVLFRS